MTIATELSLLSALQAALEPHPLAVRKRVLWFLLEAHGAVVDETPVVVSSRSAIEESSPAPAPAPRLELVSGEAHLPGDEPDEPPLFPHTATVKALRELGYDNPIAVRAAKAAVERLGKEASVRELLKVAIEVANAPKTSGTRLPVANNHKFRGEWFDETMKFLAEPHTRRDVAVRFGITGFGASQRVAKLVKGGFVVAADGNRVVAKIGGGRG